MGWDLRLWTAATNGHVHPPDERYWQGKTKNSEKNLSQCHFVHLTPTWIDPRVNPGLRGERPATNRLRRGTAPLNIYTLLPH
jgi:hypothetical protein